MTILALDLASRTGWAVSRDCGGTHDMRALRDDRGRMAWLYGQWLSDLIVTHKVRLVAVELPPRGLKGDASMVLHGLYWHTHAIAYAHDCRRTELDPISLKRWATGDWRADKAAMVAAAEARGYRPDGHDHADACLLLEWAWEREQLRMQEMAA